MSTYNELKSLQNKLNNHRNDKQLSSEKLANLTLLNIAATMTPQQRKTGFGKVIHNEASAFTHALNALGNNPILQNTFGNDLNGASKLSHHLKERRQEKVFDLVMDNALLGNTAHNTNFIDYYQHENKDRFDNSEKKISGAKKIEFVSSQDGIANDIGELTIADPYRLNEIKIETINLDYSLPLDIPDSRSVYTTD